MTKYLRFDQIVKLIQHNNANYVYNLLESPMSTVDKYFADNIAKHGGWYNGDTNNDLGDNPQCVLIVEYDNAFGGKGYGLVFDGQRNKYTASEFVRNPRIYWSAK